MDLIIQATSIEHTSIHVCVHTHILTFKHMYKHVYTYSLSHTHTHTHEHARASTHTCPRTTHRGRSTFAPSMDSSAEVSGKSSRGPEPNAGPPPAPLLVAASLEVAAEARGEATC